MTHTVETKLVHPQPLKPPPCAFIPFLLYFNSNTPSSTAYVKLNEATITINDLRTSVCVQNEIPFYTFSFSVFISSSDSRKLLGNHKFVKTFEQLENFHKCLLDCISYVDVKSVPLFPHTRWLGFSIKLDIVKQRQNFLYEYFNQLFNCPTFLQCKSAHQLLDIPENLSDALCTVGKQQESLVARV